MSTPIFCYLKSKRDSRGSTHNGMPESSPNYGPRTATFYPQLVVRFSRFRGNTIWVDYESVAERGAGRKSVFCYMIESVAKERRVGAHYYYDGYFI